jgi:NAD+ synthase (glutamine-hydrolysing)
MYIAVVQFNPTLGALRENAASALRMIDELAALPYPPDLVVFPACALTGAHLGGLMTHDAFAAECLDVTREFIAKATLPTLIGTMIPRPLEMHQSFICEQEVIYCKNGTGGALGFVDVENSWSYDRYAASIDIEIDGRTLTVILDDYPDSEDDFSHSDAIIIMLAKEYEATDTMILASGELSILRDLAVEHDSWVICANIVGGQDNLVYEGGCVCIDSQGSVRDYAEPFCELTLTVNMDFDAAAKKPRKLDKNGRKLPAANKKVIKPCLPYEADWLALCLATRDYVTGNGFSDVVIGLSGGIDSSVVAAIAVDALGSHKVHGVLLPGPYTSAESTALATELAQSLGIDVVEFPITPLFEAFLAVSRDVLGAGEVKVAIENLQARLRMTVLMHLANTYGWMLLNTGNKSEAAVGYSTLYGDTAGSFAPLGNFYKSDVYGLAQWRNKQDKVIPQGVIERDPTAELSEGQRDSDALPRYEVLDRILRMHVEENLGIDQIIELSVQNPAEELLDSAVVSSVLDKVRASEFKRRQEPPAPVFSTIDMSREREWPLTCGFRDHDRKLLSNSQMYSFLDSIFTRDNPSAADIFGN